jgi:hypothetical protein
VGRQRSGGVRIVAIGSAVAVLVGFALVGFASIASPASAAPKTDTLADTPCTATAKACVDLVDQKAWLLNNGVVTYGPVKTSSGGPGKETPVGTFKVQWKDRNHVSTESVGTPMPYSVFFADGGVAFHGGSLSRASAGCVHLDDQDAIVFYDNLKIGDQVQVHAKAPSKKPDTDSDTEPEATPSNERSGEPSTESSSGSSRAPRPSTKPSTRPTAGSRPASLLSPSN